MKITNIRTFKFWVDWCNWLLVRVETDEGVYGWGEGSLHGSVEAVETAILAAQALLPYRPYWFEEPIPFENARAMAQLQRDLPVPIATGERLLSRWEFRELLEEQGCRIIQPDLMHAAGITECRRIAALADTHYVAVAPHNSGGPIETLAAIHLAAAIPNFLVLEQMENEQEARRRICTDPPLIDQGHFTLPTRPGLGTDIRLEVVEELRFKPQAVSNSTESLWR